MRKIAIMTIITFGIKKSYAAFFLNLFSSIFNSQNNNTEKLNIQKTFNLIKNKLTASGKDILSPQFMENEYAYYKLTDPKAIAKEKLIKALEDKKSRELREKIEKFNEDKVKNNDSPVFYINTINNLLKILNNKDQENNIILEDNILFEKQLITPTSLVIEYIKDELQHAKKALEIFDNNEEINDNISFEKQPKTLTSYEVQVQKTRLQNILKDKKPDNKVKLNEIAKKTDWIINNISTELNHPIFENKYIRLDNLFNLDAEKLQIPNEKLLLKKIKNVTPKDQFIKEKYDYYEAAQSEYDRLFLIVNNLKSFTIKKEMLKRIAENKSIFPDKKNNFPSLSNNDIREDAKALANEMENVYQVLLYYDSADHIIATKNGGLILNKAQDYTHFKDIEHKEHKGFHLRALRYHSLLHQRLDLLREKMLNRIQNDCSILYHKPTKLSGDNNRKDRIDSLKKEKEYLKDIYLNFKNIHYNEGATKLTTEGRIHSGYTIEKDLYQNFLNTDQYYTVNACAYNYRYAMEKINGIIEQKIYNLLLKFTISEKYKEEFIKDFSVKDKQIKDFCHNKAILPIFHPIKENNIVIYNYYLSMPMIIASNYHYTNFYPAFKKTIAPPFNNFQNIP